MALAHAAAGLYLNMELRSIGQQRWTGEARLSRWSRMAQPLSTPHQVSPAIQPSRRIAQAIVLSATIAGVAVILAALALWFHYGTAVFFETVAAGISACF